MINQRTTYVYTRKDRDCLLAFSHAMGREIPEYRYYIDEGPETPQLDALLKTVSAGDTVIVGTITDFINTDVNDLLNALENFDDLGVKIDSRMQPNYNIKIYRIAIRLAIELIELAKKLKIFKI